MEFVWGLLVCLKGVGFEVEGPKETPNLKKSSNLRWCDFPSFGDDNLMLRSTGCWAIKLVEDMSLSGCRAPLPQLASRCRLHGLWVKGFGAGGRRRNFEP